MIKYFCLNGIASHGLRLFSKKYEKVEEMEGAQAVLVRSASMHDMDLPDELLAVARAGAGVNNIPLDKCAEHGIVVFNTPGANANGVKELVIAGMLLSARDIEGGIEWVKSMGKEPEIARIAEKHKSRFAGTELKGKKLGVIGLGAIGVKVANAAMRLDMDVRGYDPYISVKAAWALSRSVKQANGLEEIYSECDYISIHVPLMEENKKMINQKAIDLMKPSTVILNFSRDLLVDEAALTAALDERKIKKYVTDFPNPTVTECEHAIVIPHLGASTEESENNCAVMAVEQVMDYIEHGNIKNSVNFPNLDMGACHQVMRLAILHANEAGMVSKYTTILGEAKINILNMMNKSRGDHAYSMLDLDSVVPEGVVKELSEVEGVFKVRTIPGE